MVMLSVGEVRERVMVVMDGWWEVMDVREIQICGGRSLEPPAMGAEAAANCGQPSLEGLTRGLGLSRGLTAWLGRAVDPIQLREKPEKA
ncbi:hypothetical protein CDL15_Pgr021201 [Punica granatum]|uniref:Uncharacterized protein n=1 Tax=Punica granatum TaxID=22663 RepID=A0A218WWK0_PUNGR|nr:hypothetical protein CDL15_Pgr021201 [Punica granatum]